MNHSAKCMAASLALSVTVWAGTPAKADEARNRAAGEAMAQELCSGCHIIGENQSGPVPDGPAPFPVIADRPGRTVGYLEAYLSSPTPPMPHVPLSKQEVDRVIAYIRSFAE
ncbi:MAG: cytochrome c [Alphaproteobacteria bacterium]|nr:cytochrome c [Alphaproteobacteria bacterium]